MFWFRLCQLQIMHYRKLFRLYWRKWKLQIVQYLNCCNYVSYSPWDWGQFGIKFGTKHIVYLKLAILHRISMSMSTDLKVSSLTRKYVFYRTELNTKGWSHWIEFWRSWGETNQRIESSKSRWNKWGHLSSYHVYFQNYGL